MLNGPPFFVPMPAPWLEPRAFGRRLRNLLRACGQVSYFSMIWGSTAAQNYQSHFWHVKEEYVWPIRVARYRRDMTQRREAGGRKQGAGEAVWQLKVLEAPTFMMAGCRCRNAN